MSRPSKPLVIPEAYQGGDGWDEWIIRFENVATVNEWDAAAKLNWIKVCLAGRAQKAFQGLPEASRDTYDHVKTALTERFEPASKRELYNAELQVRTRKANEGWADFAEEVQRLTEKVFPDLDGRSQEQLALTHYLSRLSNPQVAFAVKQQKPKKLDEAVRATLETESFMIKPVVVGNVTPELDETTVGAVGYNSGNQATSNPQAAGQSLVQVMDRLTLRMSQLEESMARGKFNRPKATSRPTYHQQGEERESNNAVICFRCGKEGHYARGCALRHPSKPQGNERPPLP